MFHSSCREKQQFSPKGKNSHKYASTPQCNDQALCLSKLRLHCTILCWDRRDSVQVCIEGKGKSEGLSPSAWPVCSVHMRLHSVTALLCLWVRVLVSCAFCSVFFDHGLVCMCARKVSQRRWCPFGWRVYHIDCTRTMAIGWPCIGLRLSPHLPCSFQTKEAKS